MVGNPNRGIRRRIVRQDSCEHPSVRVIADYLEAQPLCDGPICLNYRDIDMSGCQGAHAMHLTRYDCLALVMT